jgi:type IV fimbrial biogenesis protein FimT
MPCPRASSAPRGVTLIEAAIAVALVAIVASAAVPSFTTFIETRRLDGVATRLAADLNEARAEALQRGSGLRVSLQHADWGSCYVVHTGSAGQCACDAAGPARCTDGALAVKAVRLSAADGIRLQSDVDSMRFDPLHGTATPTATWKLVAASGRAVHHVVNIMGRVRSCSPRVVAPAVPGWRAC